MSLTCKIGQNKYHDNYFLLISDGHCIVFSESPPSKKFCLSSLLAAGGAWLVWGVSRPGCGTRLTKGGGWTINIKYTHMPKHTVDTDHTLHIYTHLHTWSNIDIQNIHYLAILWKKIKDLPQTFNFLRRKKIFTLDIYYSAITFEVGTRRGNFNLQSFAFIQQNKTK